MKNLKNEAGYTLIESIAFIGIVIMLAISIISLISNLLDKYRISRVGQQIVEIQKSIDIRYSAAESYKGLSSSQMIEERLVPSDMVGSKTIHHAYSGNVTFSTEYDDSVYNVIFKDLPYNACVELAMVDWATGYTSHLVSLTVNEQKYVWASVKQSDDKSSKSLPMIYENALSSCAQNRKNSIKWTFQ